MASFDDALEAMRRAGRPVSGERASPKDKIRFRCLRYCGAACCTYAMVVFNPLDIYRMSRKDPKVLLALMLAMGMNRIVGNIGKSTYTPMYIKVSEVACPFLSYKRGVATCTIYDVRPNECRLYPFNKISALDKNTGKTKVFVIVDKDICPKEAFESGEEMTIEEYWRRNGVKDVGKEDFEYITKLSRVVKEWIGSKERTRALRLYIAFKFLETNFILGYIEDSSYDIYVSVFRILLKKDEDKIKTIYRELTSDPMKFVDNFLTRIEKALEQKGDLTNYVFP